MRIYMCSVASATVSSPASLLLCTTRGVTNRGYGCVYESVCAENERLKPGQYVQVGAQGREHAGKVGTGQHIKTCWCVDNDNATLKPGERGRADTQGHGCARVCVCLLLQGGCLPWQ
jgi:hypothetical protein